MAHQLTQTAPSKPQVDLLSALPRELRLEICEYFCYHCTEVDVDLRFWAFFHADFGPWQTKYEQLLRLCLTSHSLRDVAQPVLHHVFLDNNINPWKHMSPFGMTLVERPDLAANVRSIIYNQDRSLSRGEGHHTLWPRPTTGLAVRQMRTVEDLSWYLFKVIMFHAENIADIRINVMDCWSLPRIHAPNLRFLHLCRRMGMSMASRRPSGLKGAPRLGQLWLQNWNAADVSTENIVACAPNIHQLRIRNSNPEDVVADIKFLANGLLKLTSFHFYDYRYHGFELQEEVLSTIWARKDDIQDLFIQSDYFFADLGLLSDFTNLRDLWLACRLRNLPGPLDEGDSDTRPLPLLLPTSLKALRIRCKPQQELIPLAWMIVRLGETLHLYENLKLVDSDLPRRIPSSDLDEIERMLGDEHVWEAFANAGVKLKVGNLSPAPIESLV
ncbi:hypothetical protein QQX98_011648 [Neonectria punicea]|uniref:F-box domain-containing protein n=1 Tax=Neonectria punicea TaxID=979145 RepID=A0ABR1GL36_9HYPO